MHEATQFPASVLPEINQPESLLAELIAELTKTGPTSISFEDLTGVTLDNPQIRLPYRFRIHTCDFCTLAKADPNSHQHCVRNKMAANRVAIRRREAFIGQCHMGLTDLVKPLIYRNVLLGVFYYGSFILNGTEKIARERIERFCRRNNFEAAPYLKALDAAPRFSSEILPELWRKLDLLVSLTHCVIESIGVPIDRYRTRSGAQFSTWNGAMSGLVRSAVTFINANYAEQVRVSDIAVAQKCNADYLSRSFKRTIGLGIVDYLHRVRIDHARRLLLSERFTIGEIGHLVGFPDQSHFGKVFRRIVGVTPQAFRSAMQPRSPSPKRAFSTFEYSNVRPFNPKFSDGIVSAEQLVM